MPTSPSGVACKIRGINATRVNNNSEHQYDIVCIVTLYPKIYPWEDRGCAPRKGLLTLHPRGRAEATVGRLSVLRSEARRRLSFYAITDSSP